MELMLVFVLWLFLLVESVERDKCRDRIRLIGTDKEDQFKLTDVILHDSVTLDCHYCNEKDDTAPKIWYREDPLVRGNVTEVEIDPELSRVLVMPDHTLTIHNVGLADAGLYFCHGAQGEVASFRYNYLLDVVNLSVLPVLGNLLDWRLYHDSAVLKLDGQNVTMVTEWMVWGPCTSCNRAQGERRRTGKCRVKQPQMQELSCSSMLLAQVNPQTSSIAHTIPDFVQIERCTGGCSVDMKQISMKTKVHKSHVTKKQGSQLNLACTGSTLEDVVTWSKDSNVVSAQQPRISIDLFNILHVRSLEETDSGLYSCYIEGVAVHSFDVIVVPRSELHGAGLLQNMLLLLFVLLLCFVCYCGGVVVARTRRHRFLGYNNLVEIRY